MSEHASALDTRARSSFALRRCGSRLFLITIMCVAISMWICEQADGATPLLIASQEGHLEVVSALLAAGANKDAARVCFCVCEPLKFAFMVFRPTCQSGLDSA